MKAIAIFNNKGGVGKTTFLCNLASYLRIFHKKKVLVVDADPQCNATIYLLPADRVAEIYGADNRSTIYKFIDPLKRGKGYFRGNFILEKSARFQLDLIPGDPNLALAEDLLATDWTHGCSGEPRGLQTTFIFWNLISKFRKYDFIFFDVGPSLGAINRSVLLSSDYFVMPISSDVFSLMAIKNISQALNKWKTALVKGLDSYEDENRNRYNINNKLVNWKLKFAGYIIQQYTAKTKQGTRQPVKAYERILKQVPSVIKKHLVDGFASFHRDNYKLGEIPNLHSIIPMSQSVQSPVFGLKAKDGVVGAHFAKVNDAKKIYSEIARSFLTKINR
ncbi:MAG: AAA family ATPase [Candidatus Omnitrophica bacterium]|nr:AAA family ATPase [Candidatus Omnitrophota bacterium]MDD5501099.1 AAA family ATPase [Candidatus Omnitrophota bacterium]